jgi:AhpD family alkylhydroperoxidase
LRRVMTLEKHRQTSIFDPEAAMRLNYQEVLPEALRAMLGLERVANSRLDDPRLLDLVKIRASQINGCAYCVRLHAGEAREAGVTDERLDMVAVWREADCFGRAECAALAWCEALTLLPQTGAPDDVYAGVEAEFSAEEIAALTFQIVAINGWNRLAVGLRTPVGDYVSPFRPEAGVAA